MKYACIHAESGTQALVMHMSVYIPVQKSSCQNCPCLVKVENEVQLADIAKVSIQDFHKMVDDFQSDQFVI